MSSCTIKASRSRKEQMSRKEQRSSFTIKASRHHIGCYCLIERDGKVWMQVCSFALLHHFHIWSRGIRQGRSFADEDNFISTLAAHTPPLLDSHVIGVVSGRMKASIGLPDFC